MENELCRVVDALPGFVWTALPGGQIRFLNQRWCEYTGLALDRSCGSGWQAAVHPEDLSALLAGWQAGPASGAPVETEVRVRGADGKYRWFLFRAQSSADASGQAVKWCGLATDIDDRKQAEEALGASERRSRFIIDGLPTLVAFSSANGALERANRHYLEYFGATIEELKALGPVHSTHPDDRQAVAAARRQAVEAGQGYDIEARRLRADGVYRWFQERCLPLRDAQGRVALWYHLQTDIDDRKRAEALLAGEKQLLEMVARGRPISDVLESLCRLVESATNGSYCSLVLVDPGGTKLQEAIAPSLAPEFNETVRDWPLDRSGGPCVMAARDKTQVIMSDVASDTRWRNSWRTLAQAHGLRSCWSTPIVSQSGKVLGTFALYQREPGSPNPLQLELISQFTNIASIAIERAQRDAALRQSEARRAEAERELQLMIDTIPAFVTVFRPDGEREYVNKTWRDNTGLQLADIQHGGWTSIVHPDDQERSERLWRGALATGEPLKIEQRIRRHDGEYRWHMGRRVPLRDGSGNILRWYSVAIDVEDQTRAEEALRENEARLKETQRELRLTIDSIPVLVATYEPDGTRAFVNQTWRSYTGLTPQEATGEAKAAFPHFHPDDAEPVERAIRASLASGEPLPYEMRLRDANGEYRWHSIRRVPLRDENGAIIRWYSTGFDIQDQKAAENALRQSEARLSEAERELQLMIDSIPVMVVTYQSDGTRSFANQTWRNYTGITLQDTTGEGGEAHFNHFHSDDIELAANVWRTAIASGEPHEFQGRLRGADGQYRWCSIRRVPMRNEKGDIVKWYAAGFDIEDQKNAERELRATLETIPTITWRAGANGYVQQLNKRWFEYTGTTPEQVRGWRWKLCIHPDDLDRLVEIGTQYVTTAEPIDGEARIRRFDGEYRWFLFRPAPARDESGRIVGWYGIITDIEDRKRAEEALRESEARLFEAERELRRTLDSIPTMTWRAAPNGYVEHINKQAFDYTGATAEEMRGHRWHHVVHPCDLPGLLAEGNANVPAGRPVEHEARLRRSDGEYRWFLFRLAPSRDEAGKVIAWYGSITDIEDRKRAEQALQRSEAELTEAKRELQLTIDTIPITVARYSPDGKHEFVNAAWKRFSGLSEEDALGTQWSILTHPDDIADGDRKWREARATGQAIHAEARYRRADGQYRWLAVNRVPLRGENGNVIKWFSVSYDIEDQKRAEAALRASELNLRKIIDTIPALAWSARADGTAEFINQHYIDYVGLPLEKLQDWGWTATVHPDDLNGLAAVWQVILASGKPGEAEARLRRSDGEHRRFLFRVNPLHDENRNIVKWYGVNTDIEDLKQAEEELRRSETLLAEGQRLSLTGTFSWLVHTNRITFSQELYRIFEFEQGMFLTLGRLRERTHPEDVALMDEKVRSVRAGHDTPEYEIRLRMPDDRIKYVRIIGRMIQRQDGRLECLGAIQDVTQPRGAEQALDKVRSELAHVTRVMSLGAMTASIAHEVNQPLAGIVTNASTCLRMLAADPPNVEGARETARRTIRDGNRAADVITRLRALFSRKAAETETVDLSEAAREVLALVSSDLLRSRVILRAELGSKPLLVTGDRVQLQQVILNLVRNALDAMSDVEDRPRHLLVGTETEEGDRARLVVKDAGVGFEPQAAERLFDAFYTTKSDGMGIGLSISRSIIENHDGRLWAEPNDGPGATFSFSIPRQATRARDEGIAGAILTRPTKGAHDLTRNG